MHLTFVVVSSPLLFRIALAVSLSMSFTTRSCSEIAAMYARWSTIVNLVP
jgi:hypothetical protein